MEPQWSWDIPCDIISPDYQCNILPWKELHGCLVISLNYCWSECPFGKCVRYAVELLQETELVPWQMLVHMSVHVWVLEAVLVCLLCCTIFFLKLAHFALSRICPLWWDDKESACLLSHDIVAVHLFTPWNSVMAHARRWRADKPNISAQKELAVNYLSQNDPVSRKPIFLQKIIQPTPERLFALFLSYGLSVNHIRVPPFIPLAIQVVSVFVCCVASMPSHIRFLPHLAMKPQNNVGSDGIVGSDGPSYNLFALFIKSSMTEVETLRRYVGGDVSYRVNW